MPTLKQVIEALLFSSSQPLSFSKMKEIAKALDPKPKELREALLDLKNEYIAFGKAFRLEEIAQGFILRTSQEFSPFIEKLVKQKRTEKLTPASLEVLSIVAYKQPITRPQIEAIRGVDSSGLLNGLMERNLIEAKGKLEVPGRPTLYGSTKEFLEYFGLNDLSQLPKIS